MKILILPILIAFIVCENNLFGQVNYSWSDVSIEDYKLIANDGSLEDEFGRTVALDNGVVAIGAPFDNDNGTNSGSVYLFDASTGVQLFKLIPSDGTANAEFGYSIAMKNGIVAIGAKGDSENGTNAGAAYLFDANSGIQLAKLLPDDGTENDEFGNSIDIDNGVVAVGAWHADEFGESSGAAYLFDAFTGQQIEKLLPDSGNNYQTFGVSISIDNGIVAVGARTYFVLNEGYTFAKVYLYEVSSGIQINVLQPDVLNLNGDLGEFFADCLDISDGLIAVGAPQRSVVFDHSGAAYVFDISTGLQLTYLVPNDTQDRDNFGVSISIENGIVAVGAHQDDDNGFNSGSIFFFEALTGNELNKVIASDGEIADLYGCSIALDGIYAVSGAKYDDDNGNNSGSAYIYSVATLGIQDETEDNFISIYPNPSDNFVMLEIDSIKSDSYKIRIINSAGRLLNVLNETSLNGKDKVNLDVSKFESGIYFINIQMGDRSIVKKLLID